MSALTQLLKSYPRTRGTASTLTKSVAAAGRGEILWGATTFALFILLGPFSVIAALAGVLSVIPGEESMEPESSR